ncbi:MAG: GNAT family N-acetyltransferase [Actinomycetota bacterium]|nr:GNAT family N-acetyltransferase [Actinomycetota bacterium]
MELREHKTVRSFLDAASPLLLEDEPRHNLAFGICATLDKSPETYTVFHLWTVEDNDEVVGAALMTPPHNLLVNRPRGGSVLELLAAELRGRELELPGVTGALPEVDEFAAEWERVAEVQRRLRIGQGIYKITAVRVPAGVAGRMRPAAQEDRDLLVDWYHAFEEEALAEDARRGQLEEAVDRGLAGKTGGIAIWEDDGKPVSCSGFGGETPTGVRIGPVYTPPEFRRRGYGSAVTAQLSQQQLDGGRRHCFLYTDLANPTSNRIYQDIGYELVCESADYAFEQTP